ncbi:extensin [Nilaparvata lugens]|uniref:extensin n=1 Tax=Nilaparvata lugens TaxID=108931 RepID=UPI000B992279|nr:extensin [Nilaparvata lugens]
MAKLRISLFLTLIVLSSSALGISFSEIGDPSQGYYGGQTNPNSVVPLAVLANSPYSVARSSVDVPLYIVPQSMLQMITDPHIKAISPTQPLVTCQTPQYIMDATPAVKVILKKPMYIETPASTVPFPSYMSILHEGLRMNFPVGMVIAPVPEYGLSGPHLIRVVYAVPTSPLPLRYPYYEPYVYRQPEVPVVPIAPLHRPPPPTYQAYQPAAYQPAPYQPAAYQPTYPQHLPATNYVSDAKEQPNVITVLQFPSAVATPQALYYQRPIDAENELGNRGPPEALAPAGIVQSTAPHANLQAFLNSKESPILQSLRDEAQQNKNKNAPSGVESL